MYSTLQQASQSHMFTASCITTTKPNSCRKERIINRAILQLQKLHCMNQVTKVCDTGSDFLPVFWFELGTDCRSSKRSWAYRSFFDLVGRSCSTNRTSWNTWQYRIRLDMLSIYQKKMALRTRILKTRASPERSENYFFLSFLPAALIECHCIRPCMGTHESLGENCRLPLE